MNYSLPPWTRGASGVTHCGSWTARMPKDCWSTRIVCNRPAGHKGRHQNQQGYAWEGDETPRHRKPEEAA